MTGTKRNGKVGLVKLSHVKLPFAFVLFFVSFFFWIDLPRGSFL